MCGVSVADRHFYFSNATAASAVDEQVHISRMAFEESMRVGVVDRPGTGDVFMLLAPAGCAIGDRAGIHCLQQPAFIYWREQQAHYYGDPDAAWSHTWLHLCGTYLKRMNFVCPSNTCIPVDDVALFERSYAMIYDELQRTRPDLKIICNIIEHILLRAKRCLQESDAGAAGLAEIPPVFIGIKQYMDNNFALPLSLKELAQRTALSTSHFSNRFKHYYACSPIDYLIRVRMEQAKHMLSNRNLRISEVSHLVGYEDVAYFSRLLKRYFGLNPRDLRKQLLAD